MIRWTPICLSFDHVSFKSFLQIISFFTQTDPFIQKGSFLLHIVLKLVQIGIFWCWTFSTFCTICKRSLLLFLLLILKKFAPIFWQRWFLYLLRYQIRKHRLSLRINEILIRFPFHHHLLFYFQFFNRSENVLMLVCVDQTKFEEIDIALVVVIEDVKNQFEIIESHTNTYKLKLTNEFIERDGAIKTNVNESESIPIVFELLFDFEVQLSQQVLYLIILQLSNLIVCWCTYIYRLKQHRVFKLVWIICASFCVHRATEI